jgi:DNA-binding IclR family transcriptional regulator
MRSVARQTGETVVLHVVDGQQAVALEQAVATEHVVRVSQRLGARHPLVAGASGRAVLAFLPPGEVTRALRAAERPDMVVRSLESIRALGYAMSHDELQMGVAGVAVPLLGTDEVAIGSISILVPTGRARDLERHLGTLRQAAAEISAKLSPRAPRADDGGAGRR